MKIVSLIGARPQFVKAGVISQAIRRYNDRSLGNCITEIILHTGQHYDLNMSARLLAEFNIHPAYNLGIQDSLHGRMTGRMLEGIEKILIEENPNAVVVYGDTNSTIAGALAAVKLHIPIAHVEAGLRSFNMKMPEEINRIVTDRLSTWLFCPTETALANLAREGVFDSQDDREIKGFVQRVLNVGDVMYDAVLTYRRREKSSSMLEKFSHRIDGGFYLATVHRSENTEDGERLRAIFDALDTIALKKLVIMPVHPRTRKAIKDMNVKVRNISLVEPVGYFDMLEMLAKCDAVFTDSGGLQKEAFFMKKICVTLRDETEWVELVEHGFNFLTGASRKSIADAEQYLRLAEVDWSLNLYGDGHAGEKIVDTILCDKRFAC